MKLKTAGKIGLALIIANEVRGLITVAAFAWPFIQAWLTR